MTTTMSTEARDVNCTDTFGARVRHKREEAGLTQERLARSVGVTVRQMQRIEAGATKMPRLRLAQNLADFLEVPLSSLVPERAHALNVHEVSAGTPDHPGAA